MRKKKETRVRGEQRGKREILYLHKSHNTPLLPPKILHRHCFRLLLGHVHVPGEIANNEYAKFCGVKELHYGIVQVVNICCDHVNESFKFNCLDKYSNKFSHTKESSIMITEISSSVSNFQKKRKTTKPLNTFR